MKGNFYFPNSYWSQSQQSIFDWLLDTSNAISCWISTEPPHCPLGSGGKGKTEMATRPIPRAGLQFDTQHISRQKGVWEENKLFKSSRCKVSRRKHPRKVRNAGFSSASLICHIQLSEVWGRSLPFLQGFLSSSLMVTVFTSVYSASAYSPLWSQKRGRRETGRHLALLYKLSSDAWSIS